jgi:diguanylate cyclase (GGDEF)-like protein
MRQAIASTSILPRSGQVPMAVSMSIGISAWQEGEEDLQPALKGADQALYQAPQNGRNRVQSLSPNR